MEKNKKNINVISFDGGGLRGWGPSYVLSEIKKTIPTFKTLEYFDVFAGTSTGAIIVISLLIGLDIEEILETYEDGFNIFFNKNKKTSLIKELIYPQYSSEKLEEFALKYIDKDLTLRDLHNKTGKSFVICATNFRTGQPVVFASPDLEGKYVVGPDYPVIKVLKAAVGAPGYFKLEHMNINGEETFVGDGGLWANNPSSATVDLIKHNHGKEPKINVMSFGNEFMEKVLFNEEYNQRNVISLTQDLIKVVTRSQMKFSSLTSSHWVDKWYRFTIKQDSETSLDEITDSFKEAVKETYNIDREEILDFLKD